ncbi:MAG: UDP-3-O-(3-hydroxymyristoyl)glucosamine N-acyltransferase [Opitutae bacterium]|nr:UDP-3-O-(3-hydroxymyristoyl)glucosamine N-acyltransferase [Opitutae bacterium]
MQVTFTAAEISALVQPRAARGATAETIRGIAALDVAAAGDLSFLSNPKYKAQVTTTRASLLLVPADYEGEPGAGQMLLLVDNPSVALARICARIESLLWPRPAPGIHPSASVAAGAQVAASATVGPLCVVEEGAVVGECVHLQAQVFVGRRAAIGDDCWLMPGTVVAAECVLGRRVRLQPGVIIGSDGFGYEFVNGRHERIPQIGQVVLEDDVEVGANSTIDRARFSRTVVGEGTKIDNLVQVGHNVVIGKFCILCAQVGISGSSVIEDYVMLGGQAGVAGHLTVGRASKIAGGAGVTHSLPAKSFVAGNPPLPFNLDRRIHVLKQRLPDFFRRVEALEERVGVAEKTSAE